MSPTITSIDQIDLDISVAYIALGVARNSFGRCPSAENERAVADAEQGVDRLLDARLAAAGDPMRDRRRPAVTGDGP